MVHIIALDSTKDSWTDTVVTWGKKGWSVVKSGGSWAADKVSRGWNMASPYLSRGGQFFNTPGGVIVFSALSFVGCLTIGEKTKGGNIGAIISVVTLTAGVVAAIFLGLNTPLL